MTDRLIQTTIKENFADLTVLTVAHRLITITEADKILVMDAGNVVEFAPPNTLLSRPDGYFTQLLKQTGDESFHKLKHVAEAKAATTQRFVNVDPFEDADNIIHDPKTGEDLIKKRLRDRASGGVHGVNLK
jgi:ABC-type dipeptide/oligopeptide/nickel transport system ATPase component